MSDNEFVQAFSTVYFPTGAYTCEEWGEFGEPGVPVLIETFTMYSWFMYDGFPEFVILDHTMTVFDKPVELDSLYINEKIQEALDNCSQCTGLESVEVNYNENWNLVGLPLEVEDASYNLLFPESIEGTLYSYNSGYIPETFLTPGEGYWLRFPSLGSSSITGNPINNLTISLSEGWNLVSGISEDISIYAVSDPGSIIVPGTLYGFNEGYVETDILIPGKGYWLRAFETGEITLTAGASASIAPTDFSLKAKSNSITINGTELYYGIELSGEEMLSYSLPPKPLSGAFDIRFAGDTKLCSTDECVIEVMNDDNSLIIQFDIKDGENWKLFPFIANGTEWSAAISLADQGQISLDTEVEKWILRKSQSAIPNTFALRPAYPNPFNPVTTISFSIPNNVVETQHAASLLIYDITGKLVETLMDEQQTPGHHTIQWNANTFSSGVYFIRLKSGTYSQSQKLILLK